MFVQNLAFITVVARHRRVACPTLLSAAASHEVSANVLTADARKWQDSRVQLQKCWLLMHIENQQELECLYIE